MSKLVTTKEWIEKAKKIHGDKYDYSKTCYIGNDEKVYIICPIHGEFWQKARVHLRGGECPKCRKDNEKLTIKQFLEKAKKVHGNKYDYYKVDYINAHTKVCIICPKHGEFWQTPNSHLQGRGCRKCQYDSVSIKNSITQEEFIQRAKEIYGNKYDYSKVEYVNSHKKVCIICPIHGEFWQTPQHHLSKHECKKCTDYEKGLKRRKTKEEFIEESKKVHGNKYDYNKVDYINDTTKVCIICSEHGEFWQKPNKHLQGRGCPKCNNSHFERDVELFLNNNKIEYETQYHPIWLFNDETKCYQYIDFYLPKYKLMIECQGLQHFYPINFYGGKNGFDDNAKRDIIKYDKIIKNGFNIIYYIDNTILNKINEYPLFYKDKKIVIGIDELKKCIN